MVYFTKKWHDFIYSDYKKYVSDYMCYDKEITSNLEYNLDFLIDEFRNYYINKRNYVSNIENYQNEFGECEIINVLDYEDEFHKYKDKLDLVVSKALENISVEEYYENIENDLYCYALGYYKNNLGSIKDKLELVENVNSFLSSYKKYYKTLDSKFDYELTFNTSFEGGRVLNYYIDEDDTIIVVEDNKNKKYKFVVSNYKINQDIYKDDNILSLELRNFEDIKYYMKFTFDKDRTVEIKNDLIEVSENL